MSEIGAEQAGVFWIASYPRSGNTLIRMALSRILLPAEAQLDLDKNFPEYVNGRKMPLDGVHFPTANGNVLFLKTHWCQPNNAVRTVGGVYLYRHPLDVFLSALNYMFINSKNIPAFAAYFRDEPRPVEELAQTGALQSYLDRFIHDLGMMPMRVTSGSWVDNVNSWMVRAEHDDILVLSYDDLVSDLAGSMRGILDRAGIEVPPERFERGLASTRAATKRNGEFFWRASPDTKREFFSSEQIRKVEHALYPRLNYADRFPRFREAV
jgi:hypothetical protein